MRNYFKKFSIMFVVLLALIGVGIIQNGTVANAATVGQQLTQPEDGWKRYDDSDNKITYSSGFGISKQFPVFYNGDNHYCHSTSGTIKFSFFGTKIRLFDNIHTNRNRNSKISFDDGKTFESCSAYGKNTQNAQELYYEKTGLEKTIHNVIIQVPLDSDQCFIFDCFDIDKDGYLLSPSITLDKTSMDLTVGDSKQLTATTTPASVGVSWKSSDESIATVDQNGNVKGIKEGQVTISAITTDGSNLAATCTVTVASKGEDPKPPVEPTNPTDANLFIELVDGQIKSYSVSSDEINKFKQWYLDRDNTKSNKPYYEFSKGTYKDYVVHDKIDWFEVR